EIVWVIDDRRFELDDQRSARADRDDLVFAVRRVERVRRLAKWINSRWFAERNEWIRISSNESDAGIVADDCISKLRALNVENATGQCQHQQLFLHNLIFH